MPDREDADVLKLVVTTDLPAEGNLVLRMSPEIAGEVRALLDEYGLEHSAAAEFSADVTLILETVQVLGAITGGAAALASVVNTIIKRNDGKKFVIERNGEKLESPGYSERAVNRLVKLREREQADQEADWKPQQNEAPAIPVIPQRSPLEVDPD